MYVRIKLAPLRVRTVGGFRAPDPWNAGQVTDFNLEAYKMVPKGARRPQGVWGGKELYGIRSEIDGAERMLPDSLGVLCIEGRLSKEALPRLLFEMAPTLRKRDFHPLWTTKIHYVIGAVFGLMAAACVAMAGVQFAGAASGHEPVRTTLEAWSVGPQSDGQQVVTEGGVKVEGSVDASFKPIEPPNIMTYPSPDGRYRLGWIRAAAQHRLILFPAQLAGGGSVNVTGVTLRSAVLGVPPATLAMLKAKVPDVDLDFVTCIFWSWQDGYAGSSMGAAFWLVMALIAAVGGAIPVLSIALGKARRRRQMQWALGRP